MRQRNACSGSTPRCRCDPGHDPVIEAGDGERDCFLAAAAEHERIAALKAHHALTQPRVMGEQRVDLRLAIAAPAGPLADIDRLGFAPRGPG